MPRIIATATMKKNLTILFKRNLKEEIEILFLLSPLNQIGLKKFLILDTISRLLICLISASMVVVFLVGEATHHTKIIFFLTRKIRLT